jgi:hypothetical protein
MVLLDTAAMDDSTVCSLQESLVSLEYLTPASVFANGLQSGEYSGVSKPGGENTREKMANSRDICQNSKSFLGMSNGTKRSCLRNKKGNEKSHDILSLKIKRKPSPPLTGSGFLDPISDP